MTKVVAVRPYINKTGNNFKVKPFNSWVACGGSCMNGVYPPIGIRKVVHSYDLIPSLWRRKVTSLCFVQPQTIYYDTFSSVFFYEIIPFIWDCWPCYDDKLCKWIDHHKIKTCIFTSEQTADRIKKRRPFLNILTVTEGIDISAYPKGDLLVKRGIDFYTFGRQPSYVYKTNLHPLIVERDGTDEEFKYRLQHSKVTVNVPRCDVVPEQTGGQETLTQRYWECMLSRNIMIGRAPKELTDLIGYNPLIDIDKEHLENQVKDIIAHIENCQELVDRNRETALRMGSWDIRMKQVMKWLKELGYEV